MKLDLRLPPEIASVLDIKLQRLSETCLCDECCAGVEAGLDGQYIVGDKSFTFSRHDMFHNVGCRDHSSTITFYCMACHHQHIVREIKEVHCKWCRKLVLVARHSYGTICDCCASYRRTSYRRRRGRPATVLATNSMPYIDAGMLALQDLTTSSQLSNMVFMQHDCSSRNAFKLQRRRQRRRDSNQCIQCGKSLATTDDNDDYARVNCEQCRFKAAARRLTKI